MRYRDWNALVQNCAYDPYEERLVRGIEKMLEEEAKRLRDREHPKLLAYRPLVAECA
jgi:hypothetical protein